MMKSLILLTILAGLTGCAGLAPAPQVLTVKQAVWTPCPLQKVPKPVFAVDQLPIGAGIAAQMKALRVEREQRKGYELALETWVEGCSESSP